MPDVHVVVLAAGIGRRMRSSLPKVLHEVAGRPLVERVLRTASALAPVSTTLVVGHGAQLVRQRLASTQGLKFALQEEQLGTAHALRQAEPFFAGQTGTLVLLSGDVPLITVATLQRLVGLHATKNAAATVLTAVVERPYGYGRIVRHRGRLARIVEERDASPAERKINEINAGIYAFDIGPLFGALGQIASENTQGEYYLTDLVRIYRRRRLNVETLRVDDAREVLGINNRAELAEVSRLVRHQKNEELMAAGVTIVDPATTYIEADVEIGPDSIIHPGAIIEGRTRIGPACEIRSYVRIRDCEIGERVTINNFCLLIDARVAAGASIGPFAHVRPDTSIGEEAKVGNFVELKKTSLGSRSKVNHLTYLGDATVGEDVNVGAGTITCNYDGEHKHQTVIDDGAFIGSDSQLIAPVTVGKGAYVGAGSTITSDVPAGALGIARSPQTNVDDWATRRKSR